MAISTSTSGLTVSAHPGDGAVLLGFSLDPTFLKTVKLAGFAITRTPPNGPPVLLSNRLSFTTPVTSATTPAQRQWSPSDQAPFQRFHWLDFPPEVGPGLFRYRVTARLFQGTGLADGPSAEAEVSLVPATPEQFELGLTRGYLTSQAYAGKFKNAPFRPAQKSIDYDTAPFLAQYEWLGYHARALMFGVLKEAVADPSMSIDLFAYDFDEPDLIKLFEALGPRLRAVLDNAPLHTGPTSLEVQTHTRLVASAGAANIRQGHFKRFAHDKIMIQRKNGKAVKVLTGSANFSVRGLYVQANNVMVFDDPDVAGLYDQVFESVFNDMSGFVKTPLAGKWFDFPKQPGVPPFSVSFAPHPTGGVSLDKVVSAINGAKSSILFAVMELGGSGGVLSALEALHLSGKVFSYGMTQAEAGFKVYKPGQPGLLVPFAALDKHVPPPFQQEWSGGMGQVIHDKFVVIDFNDANPIVFTGSSNLAEGGEMSNGDNLLAISDPVVASAFAVEAIRLVDHYHFRANMEQATDAEPLALATATATPPWYASSYDPTDIMCAQRELFAIGPSGVKPIPPAKATKDATASTGGKPAKSAKTAKTAKTTKPAKTTKTTKTTKRAKPAKATKKKPVRKPAVTARKRRPVRKSSGRNRKTTKRTARKGSARKRSTTKR